MKVVNALFSTLQPKSSGGPESQPLAAKVLGSRFVATLQDPQGPDEIKDALLSLLKTFDVMVKRSNLLSGEEGLDKAIQLQTACLDMQTMLSNLDLYEESAEVSEDKKLRKLVNSFKKNAVALAALPLAERKGPRDEILGALETSSKKLEKVIENLKKEIQVEERTGQTGGETPSPRERPVATPPIETKPAKSEAEIREEVAREIVEAQRLNHLAEILCSHFERVGREGEAAILNDICLFPTAAEKQERLGKISDGNQRYTYQKYVATREDISSNFRSIVSDARSGSRFGSGGIGYYDVVGSKSIMYDGTTLYRTLRNLATAEGKAPDGQPWPEALRPRVSQEMGKVWIAWETAVSDSLRRGTGK